MFEIPDFFKIKETPVIPVMEEESRVFELPPDLMRVGMELSDMHGKVLNSEEEVRAGVLASEASDMFNESIVECSELDELVLIRQAVRGFYFGSEVDHIERNLLTIVDDRAVAIASDDVYGASEVVNFPFTDPMKKNRLQEDLVSRH